MASVAGMEAASGVTLAVNGKPNKETDPTEKQDRSCEQKRRVLFRRIVGFEAVEWRRFRRGNVGLLVGLASLIHCVRFERVKATLELDFIDGVELKRARQPSVEIENTVEVLASIVLRLFHQVDFDQVIDDLAKVFRAI